jgi:hypothetical protein
MTNSLYLKTLFWLAVATWAVLLFINGQSLTISLFQPSSLVLSTVIAAVTIFERWLWKWSLFHPWLVKIPNMIGVYKGELNSHWIVPATGTKRGIIPAFLVVRQTLSGIHVRLYTAESESCSVVGSFIEGADGTHELLYTYRNEPRLEIRPQSPIHYGGVRLAIGQKTEQLEGSYWTDRQSIGEMRFRRIGRETPRSFQECEALAAHPPSK